MTRLFVTGPTGEFHQVFAATPTKSDDGNGMRLIGWNRTGNELLAELGRWPYGSDVPMDRELILYDARTSKISHVEVEAALSKHFGAHCAFDFETKAWYEPDSAVVLVRVYGDSGDENLKSCVQRPTRLAINLSTGAVSSMPTR